MSQYLKYGTKQTPQSEPIPGSSQVANSAGGYSWQVDDWTRLDRFLILGSEGGSYYAGERKLTKANAEAALRCIKADGQRVVNRVVEISDAGRAAKNDPALFILAMCAGLGDDKTRALALDCLPKVARIGTHLMHFCGFLEQFRGWGRGARTAIANWYQSMPVEKLSLQCVKYQQRDGWSHRDLLRLAHPKTDDHLRNALYKWVVDGAKEAGLTPSLGVVLVPPGLELIYAFEQAQKATDAKEIASLIRAHKLPREAIPTQFLNDASVWEALLEDMPMTAMIRNLATMTRVGLLAPMSQAVTKVCAQLTDQKRINSARVHPIAILSALKIYQQGHGERGKNTWEPVGKVVDALDSAFYSSFGNVRVTNKRWMLALDVSGSMEGSIVAGVPGLTARMASGAMAMITAVTEPNYMITAFSSSATPMNWSDWGYARRSGEGIVSLPITPRMRLDDVVGAISNLPFGGTDCALPVLYALKHKIPVDVFAVYTDSETWAGSIHPAQALNKYRQEMGIDAKLIVMAMVANKFSIADPNDRGMLDIVGMDTATPDLMAGFALGEF
jgi:60 kDa SS-A/Ro ribonucleoprotein